uniref:Uncharacterized protein n=1 Tax=Electrophorus electricus TaxID=8005 RepID=A0A4W4FB20_ELEEL
MAASNYYGFTHGAGPQYSTQLAPAYSHQTAPSYSVQPAAGVAHAVTASYAPATAQTDRPLASPAYPTYQTHPAQDYGYRQQETAPQPATTPQTYQVFTEAVSVISARFTSSQQWRCPCSLVFMISFVICLYCLVIALLSCF